MEIKNKNNDQRQRRKSSLDLGSMVYGKVPPQAKDIEEAILGALLLEKDAFDVINGIIKPDCFYVEAHQRIYSAMQSLSAKSQPIDTLTVCEELRIKEELEMIGGPYYVIKLTNRVVSSANIESHSKIIIQKYIQREIIRVCGELIGSAYEDACDPLELLEVADQQITNISSALSFGDMMPIDGVIVKAIQQIEEWRNRKDKSEVTGIRTGNIRLDRLTRGWQNGDFIIIAARPSVGKTALALKLIKSGAEHLKSQNGTVAVWSLEMKAVRLVLRMLASSSEIWLLKIQTGNLTDDDMKMIYAKGVQIMAKLGILFDDKPGLTMAKLKSKARRMKSKNRLGLIVIDYLQLIPPDSKFGQNREQQVSEISRGLKNLAQELDIPIIALSQLSRAVEGRADPEPQLSDLRESGSLEQDADMVIFLYSYSDKEKEENADLINRRRIKVAKNRDGMLDIFDVGFDGTIQLFSEIEKIETGLGGNWKPVILPRNDFYEKDTKEEDPF